jgi:hypothetical protein
MGSILLLLINFYQKLEKKISQDLLIFQQGLQGKRASKKQQVFYLLTILR